MEDTPSSTRLLDPPEAPHKARNRRILIAIAVTIATALTLSTSALFVLRDNDTAAPGPSAPPSPAVGSVVTTTPTAAPSELSAIDALAPFLSTAATLDGQLSPGAPSWNPDADGTIGWPGFTIDFTAEFRDGTWEVCIIITC